MKLNLIKNYFESEVAPDLEVSFNPVWGVNILNNTFMYFKDHELKEESLSSFSEIMYQKHYQQFFAEFEIVDDYSDYAFVNGVFGITFSQGLIDEFSMQEKQFKHYLDNKYLKAHKLKRGRYSAIGSCYYDFNKLRIEFTRVRVREA